MYLLSEYTRDEVLKVIAEHASRTLPEDKDGILRAKFKEDGSVEVFFIEKDPTEIDKLKMN